MRSKKPDWQLNVILALFLAKFIWWQFGPNSPRFPKEIEAKNRWKILWFLFKCSVPLKKKYIHGRFNIVSTKNILPKAFKVSKYILGPMPISLIVWFKTNSLLNPKNDPKSTLIDHHSSLFFLQWFYLMWSFRALKDNYDSSYIFLINCSW